MSKETHTVKKALEDVVKELGRYPLEAFEFLNRGLDYTVQKAHGPLVPNMGDLLEWLKTQGVSLTDLKRLAEKGGIPPAVLEFVEKLGGLEGATQRSNRHVDGEELCWGLRELATKQWGRMALVVLKHWGIQSTKDFGRMVFTLVENGLLQKEPEDQIEDFDDVYDFDTAFEDSYTIAVSDVPTSDRDAE